jgi:hypothetical protein
MTKRPDKLERLSPASPSKLENLARDKHSSLIRKFVNYRRKCFIPLAPGVKVIKLFSSSLTLYDIQASLTLYDILASLTLYDILVW